ALSSTEVTSLKTKANGGTRIVIAYMSIGEAEDYRYYWQTDWNTTAPSWLATENPNWPGNYKVRYWCSSWHTIIYGNDTSYLKQIIEAGFDGTYLDIIDAFEYFENNVTISKYSMWTDTTKLRGANIWLTRPYTGQFNAQTLATSVGPIYTQTDFDQLAAMGANYVNISHPGLYSESSPYNVDTDAQDSLDALLAKIDIADMFAVICFRTGPG
ncbi:MAG: hypothetical protein GY869_22085, partial [Planctomycetes bacterium]|nr:hypothetical protein [Planctomycetota bacterium]